jgi:DNA-binding transcriptional ArsR family regulator
VTASGLLVKPGVPDLHRAALAAALGDGTPALPPAEADTIRAEIADTAGELRALIESARAALRADIAAIAKTDKKRPARPDTGTAVRKLRDRHPEMSAADIAARLGITDRTVRRHLADPIEDTPPLAA